MLAHLIAAILAVGSAVAAPAPVTVELKSRQTQPFVQTAIAAWNAGAVNEFPIHSSCNATQRRQIEAGLDEAVSLAQQARDHVRRWSNSSDIYKKYFGDRPVYEVIGAFDIIVSGDKSGALFRCDNPDGNCNIEGYAGHWRGSNATSETVICDRSYTTRRYLASMCGQGFTVSESPINTFWASDLMHRLYHIPIIGGGYVEHYADGHAEVMELAKSDRPEATHDSESLQYFALEAYAYDIAIPGVGCPGTSTAAVEAPPAATTTIPSPASTTSGTPTESQTASSTSDLPANCHTHEGGFVHCSK